MAARNDGRITNEMVLDKLIKYDGQLQDHTEYVQNAIGHFMIEIRCYIVILCIVVAVLVYNSGGY